jgi:hypothetical protein
MAMRLALDSVTAMDPELESQSASVSPAKTKSLARSYFVLYWTSTETALSSGSCCSQHSGHLCPGRGLKDSRPIHFVRRHPDDVFSRCLLDLMLKSLRTWRE